ACALRTGELPGFTVHSRPAVVTSAERWWQGSRSTGELRRAGFVRGFREGLGGSAPGVGAASVVSEFRTATEARGEGANDVASVRAPAPTYVAFPVGGIPSAHGFTARRVHRRGPPGLELFDPRGSGEPLKPHAPCHPARVSRWAVQGRAQCREVRIGPSRTA